MQKLILPAVLITLSLTSRGDGCWAARDPAHFAQECPIVVSGTIARIDEPEQVQDRTHDVAFIAIAKVHKNILTDEALKPGGHVKVLMSSRKSRVRTSTDLRYEVGTAGIWLIEVGADGQLHIDLHPVQRQPQEKEKSLGSFAPRELVRRRVGEPEPPFTKKDLLEERKRRADEERKRIENHALHMKRVEALGRELARHAVFTKDHFARFAGEPEEVRRDLFNQRPDQFAFTPDNVVAFCDLVLKHDPSDNIRVSVFSWLDAKTNKQATALLVRGLEDKSPSVRLFFCQALWHAPDPAVGDHVVKLLEDTQRDVRLTAVRTLGFLKAHQHVKAILALHSRDSKQDDDDWYFAESLSQLGETEVTLQCVRNCMRSTNWNVRWFAVNALQRVKSDQAVPLAMALLLPELRQTLKESKITLSDRVFTGLCQALEERTSEKLGTDAVAWHAWWNKNHKRYQSEAIPIDARAARLLVEEYRQLSPSQKQAP